MAQIVERWQRASKVEAPEPQLVILKAERGVGKTRLALEFYRWLSETIDGVGREGYWPHAVSLLDRSMDVNPDPDSCRYNVPIPYLWWGLRASDKGAENSIAGDAIATYDNFLAPHLVALTMRARMRSSSKSIVNVWRDVAKSEAASWSGYDTVISVGEGLLKTVGILRGTLGSPANIAREQAGQRSMSRVDAVLEDLESIFNPRCYTYAKTAGVILIDDAQFSKDDPGLSVFTERLLHSAMTQSWPVLILVTHWKRDLAPEFIKSERCFAGILKHGRDGTPLDNGPAAGLPGGFLKTSNTLEIDLPIVPDLTGALVEAFPGLLPDQASALLNHAGGNPRHLEQIIAFLRENEDFFNDFDTKAALTEEGFAEALKETHDIFKVVMRRLRDAPQDVQEAICLASLQGVRFVSETIDELARLHLGETRGEALAKAVNPYSIVSSRRREKIAEFSERLFYMVAERRRRSLKTLGDEVALRTSLKALLRTRLENGDLASGIEEQILTYSLAAQIFSEEDLEERFYVLLALAHVARAEAERYCHESALEAADKFFSLYYREPAVANKVESWLLNNVARLLQNDGKIAEALEISGPLLVRQRQQAERLKTPESLREMSVSLDIMGRTMQLTGAHAAATEAYRESLEVRRDLVENLKTPESLRDLLVSLNNVGSAAKVTGDDAAAAAASVEMLEVARDLAERLKTPESLRILSVSLDHVGSAAQIAGQHAAAAAAYGESMELRRDLVENLKTPESLRDLSVSLGNVGRAAQISGDHAAAAAAFIEMLEIARDLAERLKTPASLRDLSVSLDNVGRAAQFAGDHAFAAGAHAQSVEISRNLVEHLRTPESLRDLLVSLGNVGRAAEAGGDQAAATEAYAESLELARDLAEHLNTPTSLRDLSVSLKNVGRAAEATGDHARAAEAYAESEKVAHSLAERLKSQESLLDL
ncbi:tetratricopeptide repeat protein [Pseudooceanicola nitratireducens]|nr:hypothetical protein [Pseudooceanicola nitratireducens]